MCSCFVFSALFYISIFSFGTSVERCSTPGAVRITTGTTARFPTAGRVEYCYNSTSVDLYWATVCLEGWDLNTGHVACRSSNSTWVAFTLVPGDGYVITTRGFLLTLSCTGFESSLSECSLRLVSTQTGSCNERQSAGVSCKASSNLHDIILVGGSNEREGFVQIYDGAGWVFLSSSSEYWTTTHTQVACNQLGYSGGSVPTLAAEPQGLNGVFSFVCPSNARALPDCTDDRSVFSPNTAQVTLSCTTNGQPDGTLRLARSARSRVDDAGVLEVSVNGRYGTICSSGFFSNEEDVACKTLGFQEANTRESRTSSEIAFDSKPVWMVGTDCRTDDYTNLFSECTFDSPLGGGVCYGSFAHVACSHTSGENTGIIISCVIMGVTFIIIAMTFIIIFREQIKSKLEDFKDDLCSRCRCDCDCDCGCLRSVRLSNNNREASVREDHVLEISPPLSWSRTDTNTRSTARSRSDERSSRIRHENVEAAATGEQQQQQQQQQQQEQQQQQPLNPEFSAGAPPSYNIADTFAKVDEEGEKPPPYMEPPEPVGPSLPYPSSEPSVGPGYTPPTLDPAYPPPVVCPPSDVPNPPPTHP